MKFRLLTSLGIVVLVVATLFFNIQPAHAAVSGSLTSLTFPGASGTNCGYAQASNGSVTSTTSVSDVGTLYDGNGTVVGSFSSTWIGTFTITNINFSTQPAKNPIRMVEVLGGVTVVDVSADNPCLPASTAGYAGPPIPAGFVLKTITCTTLLYVSPGGQAVNGSDKVLGGQTWYVNPTPVKDKGGKSWTEIFVSSTPNPFIPTSCVG